jgi:uncharacterized protein
MRFWSECRAEIRKLAAIERKHILRDVLWAKEHTSLVAQSFGLGVFIGFTPTVGVQTILCFVLAKLLRRNFLATFAGSFIPAGTPLQIAFCYLAAYRTGCALLGRKSFAMPDFHGVTLWKLCANMGGDVLVPLWVGGLVLGVIGGGLTYLVALRLMRRHHERAGRQRPAT